MMPAMAPAWTLGYAAGVFVVWAVMMAAMMLPAAARVIVPVLRRPRGYRDPLTGWAAAMLFLAAFLSVWTAFSAAATLAQWGLDRAGALSMSMAVNSAALAALLVAAAGLYQFSPWKAACLRRCRLAGESLALARHRGAGAALDAGIRYGASGIGSCGLLMALLFVAGVMNLWWIAGTTVFVFAEQALVWTGRGREHLT